MLTARLAGSELGQQLRGPVFRIVAFVSLLMVVGAAAIDALRIDVVSGLGSGPELVVRVHLVWTLFYLFTAASFVGEAATRDEQTGFAPLVRATPASRPAYLLARFGGAAAAVLLCFLTVPLGLLAARLLPGADPAWAAPAPLSAYLLALFALAVPNLLLACALFLALATATRSMAGCLVGAVALLGLYGAGVGGGVPSLFEPFGFVAAEALRAGAAAPLIANRALWLGAALLLVGGALWLDARAPRGVVGRRANERACPVTAPPRAVVETRARPRHDARAALLQLLVRTRHHVRETVKAPTFRILLLLGLGSCLANLWPEVRRGAAVRDLVATLIGSFALVPVVVILFFTGEIHWSDRVHRMDRIVGAAPVARPVLLLAEVAALGAVLLLLALATGVALPMLLVAAGRPPDLAAVLESYVLPKTYDWLLLGVLAWFLQTLSPSKFAGWGYFVLFLIANLALDQAGLTDPALHYGRYPGAPVPPVLSGNADAQAYRGWWGGLALLLIFAASAKARTPEARAG
ncbi:MAG: hypothetical protein AVDCRST_MAG39-2028 [uncultured Sphingomonadaceae bacterium]|uniref:Uncharacterized protein n=1 Tax=uncultured Sphingomonadaceae bacterium TaxID=169976 RepID=A0A6J4T2E0_9SPHN|nr:MAG: hypothetical protein AVDCRST_MAG39-2028 [uncultured Sphingomonadaceae bacterium]